MSRPVRGYLSELGAHLHLPPSQEGEILQELQGHLEDRAQELADSGISIDAALNQAMREMGESRAIANGLYEVHSRRSWYHAGLAALPHVLLSLMFALHIWTAPIWVSLLLGIALIISVLGWRAGRPTWTFPWLGYCLMVPLISWGLAMSAVGYGAWGIITNGSLPFGIPIYLGSLLYIGVSLWIVIRVVSRVARKDWLMASLTVLPIPFLAYWFLYFYDNEFFTPSGERVGQSLQEVDSSAAIVFLILAIATAVFFRVGRRAVRVALLVITAPSIVILAWVSYQGGVGQMAVFGFAALSLIVLFAPALFGKSPVDIARTAVNGIRPKPR
jgi:hypothetical protein